jgi:hypothetical protein
MEEEGGSRGGGGGDRSGHDLKVTVDEVVTVVPSAPTPHDPLFLSNIDQTVAFPVETVFFYEAKPGLDPRCLVGRIRDALGDLLVPYYPLAGRVRFNADEGRLEIDCNAKGAFVVSATSALSMEELGEISFVNPGYKSFVLTPADEPDPPIVTIQVPSLLLLQASSSSSTSKLY